MAFLEQFIRFTTDAVGLERILRLVQSLLQVVVSFPLLLGLASSYLGPSGSSSSPVSEKGALATAAILVGIRERVNLGRRFFRVFRFVESFDAAQKLLVAVWAPVDDDENGKARKRGTIQPEWLDLFARMFSGMYLFLETLTVVDAMAVQGLAVWGPGRAHTLNVEGQRYWFLSLACSVASTLVRMTRVTRDIPLPAPTEEEKHQNMGSPLASGENDGGEDAATKAEKHEEERLRLRRIVQGRMVQRRAWVRALRARLVVLGRRAVADGVDLLLPGAIVGWTPVQPSTVGVAMLFTTLLTGYDVWLRCGREVAEAAEAAEAVKAAKTAAKTAVNVESKATS